MFQKITSSIRRFFRINLWFMFESRMTPVNATYRDYIHGVNKFSSRPGDDDIALARARARRVRKGIFRRRQIMGRNAMVRELIRKADNL